MRSRRVPRFGSLYGYLTRDSFHLRRQPIRQKLDAGSGGVSR